MKVWLFTAAGFTDEALGNVSSFLEHSRGDGSIVSDGRFMDSFAAGYWQKLREDAEDRLAAYRKEAELFCGTHRRLEGFALVHVSNMLLEKFCPDMPFYNMEMLDWSVPARDAQDWWAVEVKLWF